MMVHDGLRPVRLLLLLLLGSASARSPSPSACTAAADCFYNGDCVQGSCACSPGWTGSACAVLDRAASDRCTQADARVIGGRAVS